MTNYNDGNWHGWNGGECPVHPKSIVEAVWHDPKANRAGVSRQRPAREEVGPTLAWQHVVKFRVIKEHREPREFWLVPNSGDIMWVYSDQIRAKLIADGYGSGEVIHVREVLE